MRLQTIIPILLTLMLTSCFMGADNYEKSVNDFFFLYSDSYKTDSVCLGSIHDGKYRIGDGYLCVVKRIGWDNSFLICETRGKQYFIQDLRQLKNKSADDFESYLFGPFTKQAFGEKRDSLGVDKDLDFSVSY